VADRRIDSLHDPAMQTTALSGFALTPDRQAHAKLLIFHNIPGLSYFEKYS
jgi:hypothetical protein